MGGHLKKCGQISSPKGDWVPVRLTHLVYLETGVNSRNLTFCRTEVTGAPQVEETIVGGGRGRSSIDDKLLYLEQREWDIRCQRGPRSKQDRDMLDSRQIYTTLK